jgi:hypothetical protein
VRLKRPIRTPPTGSYAGENPWLRAAADPRNPEPIEAGPGCEALPAVRLEPQPAAVTAPDPRDGPGAGWTASDLSLPVWVFGAHGGAGETTIATLLPGARACERRWPTGHAAARVVVVARTHATGLLAAQETAIDWAAGNLPGQLLGLVTIADAPGRLPRPLNELESLVAGAFPHAWRIGWHEPWRLGEPARLEECSRTLRIFAGDIRSLSEWEAP